MKANKIVFSTIAALALSSSAFGADTSASYTINTDWYKQVYDSTKFSASNNLGDLSVLGWSEGKNAIAAMITGDDASFNQFPTELSNGLLGALNTELGNEAKVSADYKTYGSGNTQTIGVTKTEVAAIETAATNTYELKTAINDYVKVQKAIKVADKGARLLAELDNTNEKFAAATTDLQTSFALTNTEKTDLAKLKKIARVLLDDFASDVNSKKADLEAIIAATDNIPASGADNVEAAIKAVFDATLAKYQKGSDFKAISKDKTNMDNLREAIKTNAEAIIAKAPADNKANVTKLTNDLAAAVAQLNIYTANADKLAKADEKITAAVGTAFVGDTATSKFANSFQYIYKKGNATSGEYLSTKAEVETAVKNKIIELTSVASAGDYATTASGSLEQVINYVNNKQSSKTVLDALAGGTYDTTQKFITTDAELLAALKHVKSCIDGGKAIDTTGLTPQNSKELSDLLTELSDLSTKIAGMDALDDYNTAIVAAKALDDTKLQAIKTANNEKTTLENSLAGELFGIVMAQQQIDEALSGVLEGSASGEAKQIIQDALMMKDASGKSVVATVDTITTKVDALGYDSAIDENSTKLFEEFGVELNNTDADTKKASIAALKTAITDRYGKYGIKIDGSGKVALKDGVTITDKDGNEVSSTNMVDVMKRVAVIEQNDKIQTAVNKIAQTVVESKKDSLAVEGLSTLNIQLNNMNKRLGEIRGLDGEIGVWLRTWGGKMSADHDSFKYYSTQLGADKKTAMKDGDLYLGVLVGYDNVKSDIKSNAYSVGAYASYIDNSGFFADGVMKFVSTKNERSGFDLSNQQTLLASIEGGYRFDMSDGFYVEPSLEFVTGHVGEYKSVKDNTTLKVDSFTPVVFKPQVFVGGSADAFTYRAGIGGVLSMQGQDASVTMANVIKNLDEKDVSGTNSVKLSKNNHGFASIGGSFKASENFRINLGVERSFGGDLTNDYEVNMTLRYGF